MCSTDVYRVRRAEEDDSEEEAEKIDVELVCASARLEEAIVSVTK